MLRVKGFKFFSDLRGCLAYDDGAEAHESETEMNEITS